MPASTAAGSSARSATRPRTASTGTSSAAAAEQKALIYDSPVTNTHAQPHLRRAARRGGDAGRRAAGPGRQARATASSSTCRWCPRRSSPCWPAPASAPSIRWCSAASPRRSWPPASTMPSRWRSCRPRAASSPAASSHYKPLLDAAIELSKHKPPTVLMLQRPMAEATMIAGPRPRLGQRDRRRQGARPQGRLRRGQGHRPALHPLHVRHHRPAQGRGARQRRAHGGAQVDHEEPLRHRARRGLLGGLRRRLGGGPLLHLLRAAAARLHDHPLRGQAGRHARCRRVLARDRRARRGGHVHRAHRLPRHQEGGPQGRAHRPLRPQRLPHPVPGRRARRPRDHQVGRGQPQGAGLRPLVADRDRLADLRQPGGPRRAAREVRLADRADAGLRPAGAGQRAASR